MSTRVAAMVLTAAMVGLIASVMVATAGAAERGRHGRSADRLFDPVPPPYSTPGRDTTRTATERQDRESAWVERCAPRVVPGPQGVGRYVYAKPGCEFGD